MPWKLAGANPIQNWSWTRAGCRNLPDPILKGHGGVSSCQANKEKPHQPNSSKEHFSRCSQDQHHALGFLYAKERVRVRLSLPGKSDQAWGKWRRMLDAKQPHGSPSWSKAPAPILQPPSLSGPGSLQNQVLHVCICVMSVNILKGANPDVSCHTHSCPFIPEKLLRMPSSLTEGSLEDHGASDQRRSLTPADGRKI